MRRIKVVSLLIVLSCCYLVACSLASTCDSSTCGLRAYLADLQKEYNSLTIMYTKLSKSVDIMIAANSTALSTQIRTRQTQLKKIQNAQQSLYAELSVIEAKCNSTLGDDCTGLYTIADSLGRRYPDGTYASSCASYRNPASPYAYNNEGSGLYQIKIGSNVFTVYCDMETLGGGWTLTMKTSSSSSYVYSDSVWTNTDVANPKNLTSLLVDEDYVSPAFYKLAGKESMLAMNSTQYFNTWSHNLDNARNLANGVVTTTPSTTQSATCSAQSNCGTQPINKKPLGLWQSLGYDYYATYYYRFGYVNYVSIVPAGWGAALRVGFSGDGDTSDSGGSNIGIGIACTGSVYPACALSVGSNVHGKGSGFYFYKDWNTAASRTNGALRGWLWIR